MEERESTIVEDDQEILEALADAQKVNSPSEESDPVDIKSNEENNTPIPVDEEAATEETKSTKKFIYEDDEGVINISYS